MRVRCDGELFHQAFRRYTGLLEMTQHLFRRRFGGPVRGSNLHSMILRLVLSDGGDISSDLTIFQLSYMRTVTGARKRTTHLENRDREACAVLVPHSGHATLSRYDACSYGIWHPFRDSRGRQLLCLCICHRTLVNCPTGAKRRTTSRCPEAKHGMRK
jgi:hypothetical protein